MQIKYQIFTLYLTLICLIGNAQKNINFTQQLTFDYQKDGQKGEFSVFLEPKTNTWLLEKNETFAGKVDDIDYWILQPDGKIIILGTSETGKKTKLIYKNPLVLKSITAISGKKTKNSKLFGKNNYGWQTLKGEQYLLSFGKGSSNVYLSKASFDCRPLLAYNFSLDVENYLPAFYSIDYPSFIPKNYLVVEETNKSDYCRLKFISPTEYSIDLDSYK